MLKSVLAAAAVVALTTAAMADDADPLAPVMERIYQGETGNDPNAYFALYGGGYFGFPQWPGKYFTADDGKRKITHAAGRGQFQPGTWKTAALAYIAAGNSAPDFNRPADQEAVGRFWAAEVYRKKTGRDLVGDAKQNSVDYAALSDEWTSLKKVRAAGAPKREASTSAAPVARTPDLPKPARCWDVFAKDCPAVRRWDVFAQN